MALAEKLKLSAEDYLYGEATAQIKHEYLDGDMSARVGASDSHVSIAMNLAFLLKQALKDTPCRAYISDMKVNVARANAFFYPDVLMTCEPKDRDKRLFRAHRARLVAAQLYQRRRPSFAARLECHAGA